MATFTRRHYELIAQALNKTGPVFNPTTPKTKQFLAGSDAKFTEVVAALTLMFREDNPKFDITQFQDAVMDWGKEPGSK